MHFMHFRCFDWAPHFLAGWEKAEEEGRFTPGSNGHVYIYINRKGLSRAHEYIGIPIIYIYTRTYICVLLWGGAFKLFCSRRLGCALVREEIVPEFTIHPTIAMLYTPSFFIKLPLY